MLCATETTEEPVQVIWSEILRIEQLQAARLTAGTKTCARPLCVAPPCAIGAPAFASPDLERDLAFCRAHAAAARTAPIIWLQSAHIIDRQQITTRRLCKLSQILE